VAAENGEGNAGLGAGGRFIGAGAGLKLTKQVRLAPAAIRKLRALQKRKGQPSFSAAIEAAAEEV
jgi:hypothetical protein